MRIMIDPGHGGRFTGAVGSRGVPEKAVTLAVGAMIAGFLSNSNCDVVMSRTADESLAPDLGDDLAARCRAANHARADAFLSIHCNAAAAPSACGFEVWTSPAIDAADWWATRLWNAYRSAFPDMRGRVDLSDGDPDKEAKFAVLVGNRRPAVLFELAFISNTEDQDRLLDPAWQARAAAALADATREWGLAAL